MDEMKRIVICKHCGKPEYYDEMRWLSGICSCRNCYKEQYERERHEIYEWSDLDGKRPTMDEYQEQERKSKHRYQYPENKDCGTSERASRSATANYR